MRAFALFAVLALLLLAAGAASAEPCLSAPDTGLVDVPTAYVAVDHSLAAAWQDLEGDADAIPVRLLLATGGYAEVGAGWARLSAFGDTDEAVSLAGKYQLAHETARKPAIALGIRWAKLDLAAPLLAGIPSGFAGKNEMRSTQVYLAASKTMPTAAEDVGVAEMAGHVGIAWHQVSREFSLTDGVVTLAGDDTTDGLEGFAALEAHSRQGTVLAVEYRSKLEDFISDAIVSVLARHQFTDEVTGEIGWTNAAPAGSLGLGDHQVFVGFSYSFLARH